MRLAPWGITCPQQGIRSHWQGRKSWPLLSPKSFCLPHIFHDGQQTSRTDHQMLQESEPREAERGDKMELRTEGQYGKEATMHVPAGRTCPVGRGWPALTLLCTPNKTSPNTPECVNDVGAGSQAPCEPSHSPPRHGDETRGQATLP